MHKLLAPIPLQYRVLYSQFLLRVVDLEALSIQADIVGFLGQFAGLLIMVSLIFSARLVFPTLFMTAAQVPEFLRAVDWSMVHSGISTMMLVVGLITVITWDATFPDRRDVMVLSPLPVATHVILCSKVLASVSVLGLAVLALNMATGLVFPLVLGPLGGSVWSVPRFFLAYWFCMAAASAFLYGSVLAVQGFTALVLPRRIFLRLSAVLQLAAFGLLLFVYFLEPSISTHQALAAPENQKWLASSPSFWFLALFNWLNGSLPSQSNWLAWRACIGLTAALIGAAASLLLCYVRTMKKAVEEPDLVPGSHGWHWTPRFGSALQTAIILFSVRSLTRSRQHRVAFALFLALVFAIALLWLRGELAATAPEPVPVGFLISTFLMLCFAVFALRSIYALPISLTANWVLRTTQLRPSEDYIAATRRSMLLFSVIPICLLSSALSFNFRPFHQVAAHLAVLAVLGWILSELSLIGFYKVPFTCSYLPGKANIQFIFCGFFVAMIIVIIPGAAYESDALGNPFQYALMMAILAATACGLWVFNRYRSKSAVIYFEELPEELITTLRLISIPPPRGE